MKKIVFFILFITAFLERTVFDLGPNMELITATMILSSIYLGRKYSFTLVFLIIVLSDIVIGNSNIFIFTWTGFLLPALVLSKSLTGKINRTPLYKIIFGTSIGISSTLFFFLWTNFGVWALDSWSMYSNDIAGLASSYINALPFLRLHLLSTFTFVPSFILTAETVMFLRLKIKNLLSRQAIAIISKTH